MATSDAESDTEQHMEPCNDAYFKPIGSSTTVLRPRRLDRRCEDVSRRTLVSLVSFDVNVTQSR
jgi:hypothetical protein